MENYSLITDNSHNKIYQTYAELKKKLPPKFFRIKVFSTPKYNFDKNPILKKIENNKNNTNNNYKNPFLSGNKNIYILSNITIGLKKTKNMQSIKSYDSNNISRKNIIDEKAMRIKTEDYKDILSLEEPIEEMDLCPYYFHSNPVKDAQMKNNIYLPKIMDRMKYSIPRSERDKGGFLVEGKKIFSNN